VTIELTDKYEPLPCAFSTCAILHTTEPCALCECAAHPHERCKVCRCVYYATELQAHNDAIALQEWLNENTFQFGSG
jgi:hypothetical protein